MRRIGAAVRALRSAWRAHDDADALPAALTVAFAASRPVVDAVAPAWLSLTAPDDPLLDPTLPERVAHAVAAGCAVEVVTPGTRLDNAHARALLDAGLGRLTVTIDAAAPDERALRFVVGLLAMRDALRAPGPVVALRVTVTPVTWRHVVPTIARCRARIVGAEPLFVVDLPDGHAAALVELRRGRALAARAGLWRTVASLDVCVAEMTRDRARAPCRVPWTRATVRADGALFPCAPQAARGEPLGNVLERPFSDVWNDAPLRAFRRRLRDDRASDPVCAACRHAGP